MAKLTEKQKRAVPKSKRGVPSKSGTGSFPMPDKKHAQAAIMLSGHAANPAAVKAKARRILAGKGK